MARASFSETATICCRRRTGKGRDWCPAESRAGRHSLASETARRVVEIGVALVPARHYKVTGQVSGPTAWLKVSLGSRHAASRSSGATPWRWRRGLAGRGGGSRRRGRVGGQGEGHGVEIAVGEGGLGPARLWPGRLRLVTTGPRRWPWASLAGEPPNMLPAMRAMATPPTSTISSSKRSQRYRSPWRVREGVLLLANWGPRHVPVRRRFLRIRPASLEIHKAVAEAALVKDVLGVGGVRLDLLAQVGDVQPQVAGCRRGTRGPRPSTAASRVSSPSRHC